MKAPRAKLGEKGEQENILKHHRGNLAIKAIKYILKHHRRNMANKAGKNILRHHGRNSANKASKNILSSTVVSNRIGGGAGPFFW